MARIFLRQPGICRRFRLGDRLAGSVCRRRPTKRRSVSTNGEWQRHTCLFNLVRNPGPEHQIVNRHHLHGPGTRLAAGVSPRALRSLPSQEVPRKMPADPLVVFSEGIVAETPQGLTVILGRARAGDEQARESSSPSSTTSCAVPLGCAARAARHPPACWARGSSTGRRTAASCSPRRRGRCGRCSSTTPGGGLPDAAAGAGGVALDAVVDCFEGQGLDVVAVHEALDRRRSRTGGRRRS